MRLAKQGKNEGNHFWGCSDYPNCKGIQDATEAEVKEYNNAEAPVSNVGNIARVFNESQSSYEFGKANNRHKVYYNDVSDLLIKIDALKIAGLIEDELLVKPEDFLKENENN